jgi:DNA-directed RNA polymerase specialized sigma24 family protein
MTAEKESEIIEKYYNEVRNFIKSRMNGDDDFEAVTQETFIIFIRKLRTEKVLVP